MTLSELAVWLAERLLAPVVVALGVFLLTRRHYIRVERRQKEQAQKAMMKLLAYELGENRSVLKWFPNQPGPVVLSDLLQLDVFRASLRDIGELPGDLPDELYGAYTAIVTAMKYLSGYESRISVLQAAARGAGVTGPDPRLSAIKKERQTLMKQLQVVTHEVGKIVLDALHALPDGKAVLEAEARDEAEAEAAQAKRDGPETTPEERDAEVDREGDI